MIQIEQLTEILNKYGINSNGEILDVTDEQIKSYPGFNNNHQTPGGIFCLFVYFSIPRKQHLKVADVKLFCESFGLESYYSKIHPKIFNALKLNFSYNENTQKAFLSYNYFVLSKIFKPTEMDEILSFFSTEFSMKMLFSNNVTKDRSDTFSELHHTLIQMCEELNNFPNEQLQDEVLELYPQHTLSLTPII